MSQLTHTIQLRDGKRGPEKVTDAQLKQAEETIVGFKSAYIVTKIEQAEKPGALAPARPPRAASIASASAAEADASKTE